MGCGGSKEEKPQPEKKPDAPKEDAKKSNAKAAAADKAASPKEASPKAASPKAAAAQKEEADKPVEEAAAATRAAPADPEPAENSPVQPLSETEPVATAAADKDAAQPANDQSVPPIDMNDIREQRDRDNGIPVEPAEKLQPYQVNSSAANKQAGKDPLMITGNPDGAAGEAPQRSPRRASEATPRRLQRRSQGNNTHRAVNGDDEPMKGPGPSSDFPTEVMYPCFDEGQLYRLVNQKRHMWGFYNDSTDYIMHVEATFGHESMVRALGKTEQVVHDESTGHCTLTLDIEPMQTEPFMRGEFNGFAIYYDAEPLPYEERQKHADAANATH